MKKLAFLILLTAIYGCQSNDDQPYDPAAQLQTDLALIDAHLATEGQAVIIHPSGIRYTIENEGQGVFPVEGDSVTTRYGIYTLDGVLLDTNNEDVARANGLYLSSNRYTEFVFVIGVGTVIQGYEIGTKLLNTGAQGTFFVPSTLAYGNSTSPPRFGPNQILRIEIRVESVN